MKFGAAIFWITISLLASTYIVAHFGPLIYKEYQVNMSKINKELGKCK